MKSIEDLKKRLWSRMRNYTDDKRILKRYMNDLNLLEQEGRTQTLEKVKEKILEFEKEGKITFWQKGNKNSEEIKQELLSQLEDDEVGE